MDLQYIQKENKYFPKEGTKAHILLFIIYIRFLKESEACAYVRDMNSWDKQKYDHCYSHFTGEKLRLKNGLVQITERVGDRIELIAHLAES